MALDPKIVLLIGAESGVLDESSYAKTLTAVGNAARTTAQFKYGAASLVFDGSGDWVTVPDSADWAFGSGDFTVEGYVRFVSKVASQAFIGQWTSTTDSNSSWFFYVTDTGLLRFRVMTATTTHDVEAPWVPTLGKWYHLAADRVGTTLRIYVDGVMVASDAAFSYAVNDSTNPVSLGAIGPGGLFPSFDFNGQMDEIRVTKGLAWYAGTFPPPTGPFLRDTSTAPVQLSQLPLEVLILPDAPVPARVSQAPLEVLVASDPNVPARVSQVPLEVAIVSDAPVPARLSQVPLEVLVGPLVTPTGPLPQRINITASSIWTATPGATYASDALNVTAGNTLVVAVGALTTAFGEYVTGITDSAGNTYVKVDHVIETASDFYREEVWVASNVAAHASNVVTVAWSAPVSYRGIVVVQYFGLNPAGPLDASAKGTSAAPASSATTGTLTSTKWDDVHILIPRWGFGGTTTFPTGFTQISPDSNALLAEKFAVSPYVGTYTVSHTASSQAKTILAVAFAPVQGAGTARVTQAVTEALTQPSPAIRVSHVVAETLTAPTAAEARTTQFVVESVILPTAPPAQVSQFVVELLVGPYMVVPAFVASTAHLWPPDVSALLGLQTISLPVIPSNERLYAPIVWTGPVEVLGATINNAVSVQLFPPAVLPEYPRVTQAGAEVSDVPTPASRVTAAGADLTGIPTPSSRVTQAGDEVVDTLAPSNRMTTVGAEVTYGLFVPGRITHVGVEVVWGLPEVILPEGDTIGLVWAEFVLEEY